MKSKFGYIIAIAFLLGISLLATSVYITSGYQISSQFISSLLQNLGLAICFPIIIAFVFENLSRERILQFVERNLVAFIDRTQNLVKHGFTTVEIGPDEQTLRDLMFKETEEATSATFLFLRAGLILRVMVPVFKRVLDKGGRVTIMSPPADGAFVKSIVVGLSQCSQKLSIASLPRTDTADEIRKRDAEMALDYAGHLKDGRLKILKTQLYVPYGCLLLEKEVHGHTEKVIYWFPFVISKTCGYGPVFRISDGTMVNILAEDMDLYVRESREAMLSHLPNSQI